jgi:hypothetical protein
MSTVCAEAQTAKDIISATATPGMTLGMERLLAPDLDDIQRRPNLHPIKHRQVK